MKKLTVALLTVAVMVTGAYAGTSSKTFKETVAPVSECKFRDQELQIDAFGLGAFYNEGRPGWGGGLGINYFFSKFIGVGIEQDMFGRKEQDSQGYTEWATAGNVFLRLPICSLNLAPFAVVGGGAAYGGERSGHGFGHVGGGLEYRVTDNIGLFSDARYVYSTIDPENAVAVRTGLRFAF